LQESHNKNKFFLSLLPDDVQIDLEKVEERIKSVITTYPPLIEKVGKHVMGSGGKRLRPILHILAARFSGHSGEDSVDVAASTEIVHTATLLHDDVIDSSLTRRGKPSANVLWGNKSSILVGDYLFSQCLNMLVGIRNNNILHSFTNVFSELSIGEMLELINEHNLGITLDSYFEIIDKKTSSLFKLCMEAGTMFNENGKRLNGCLSEFGVNFGLTFQLVDDYLDYFGDNEKMGKPIMGDFKEKKVTLPLIHLNSLCNDKERESIKETFYQLNIHESEELFIKGLMEKYRIDKIVLEQAKEYNEKAYKNLKEIEDSQYKKALLGILEYNLTRDR